MLSQEAQAVWAKSWPMGGGAPEYGLGLWWHLRDAASVAGRLWDVWLPSVVRRLLGANVGSEDGARTLLTFLAGVHDIGKATPAFASQVMPLADAIRRAGLPIDRAITSAERHTCPHGLSGQVILQAWLERRHGWDNASDAAGALGAVVGGHHGIPPGGAEVRATRRRWAADPTLLGDASWIRVQNELLDHLAEHTGATSYLADGSWCRLPTTAQALLTALVVVADWLASNAELFPLVPLTADHELTFPERDDAGRLEAAWTRVNLPRPWNAADLEETADALLRSGFDLPGDAVARPVQREAVDAARTMDVPGMLVIEAPMGEGKTEAALLAAQILAARSGAGGLIVALPTQATADAMFRRLMAWQARIPEARVDAEASAGPGVLDDDGPTRHAVCLAHGKAWLNPDFAAIPNGAAATVDVDRDGAGPRRGGRAKAEFGAAYVDAWLRGSRKGVLADFVVGTIDQVLFGALQSRHVALRHLALARKVVVLDEVHAFDAYMSTYLERALEWLGAYGVAVVALSATLPRATRQRLLAAHARGVACARTSGASTEPVRSARGRWGSSPPRPVTAQSFTTTLDGGPVASTVISSTCGAVARHVVPDGTSTRAIGVRVERLHVTEPEAELAALVSLLDDLAPDAGCVLVVRNTVARAQETYDVLAEHFGDAVELLHSRFLALDRKEREARLVRALGPSGEHRPSHLILVATQVVEQSLDVDFDLLVTDLAPTDLLLQRVGRLHRHARAEAHRPERLREARVVVTGVVDNGDIQPPWFPRGSERVYGRHLLLRAAAQVRVHERFTLPRDIAPLVQEAYGDDVLEPPGWQTAVDDARARAGGRELGARGRAREFLLPAPSATGSLVGWLDRSVGEADGTAGRAAVRESEDSIEVLVVQTDSADQWRIPDWVRPDLGPDDRYLPRDAVPRAVLLRLLAGCSVRLPGFLPRVDGHDPTDSLIDELERLVVDAWQRDHRLGGQLVLPLDGGGRATLAGLHLHYAPRTGLTVTTS